MESVFYRIETQLSNEISVLRQEEAEANHTHSTSQNTEQLIYSHSKLLRVQKDSPPPPISNLDTSVSPFSRCRAVQCLQYWLCCALQLTELTMV